MIGFFAVYRSLLLLMKVNALQGYRPAVACGRRRRPDRLGRDWPEEGLAQGRGPEPRAPRQLQSKRGGDMTVESELPPDLVTLICRFMPGDDRPVRVMLRIYFARIRRRTRRQGRWEIDESPRGPNQRAAALGHDGG
jgi:hypothetical protein